MRRLGLILLGVVLGVAAAFVAIFGWGWCGR